MPQWIKETAKAAGASVMAGLAAAITAISDDRISSKEWLIIASAVVATWIATWYIPNADPTYEINKKN